MGTPYNPYIGPSTRRLKPDGQVDILCRICGRKIVSRLYDRFSTATCASCYREELAGCTPEEIIYRTQQAELAQVTEAQESIGTSGFKAIGLRKRVTDVLSSIKERIAKKHRNITKD